MKSAEPAYFCRMTGVRIAAPGVCKACDPDGGQDEVVDDGDGGTMAAPESAPADEEKPGSRQPSQPPAPPHPEPMAPAEPAEPAAPTEQSDPGGSAPADEEK